MIEKIERVIHPGWLTVMVDDRDSGVWACHHKCVDCGFIVAGGFFRPEENILLRHRREHKGSIFALELYQFRASIHALDVRFGLEAFEWPDRNERGHRRAAGLPL
jgi:hypothetical protein